MTKLFRCFLNKGIDFQHPTQNIIRLTHLNSLLYLKLNSGINRKFYHFAFWENFTSKKAITRRENYCLNSNFGSNMGMWIIIKKGEIFKFEIKDIFDVRIYFHLRLWEWLAGELEFCLFQVVRVQMCIAECMDELAGF